MERDSIENAVREKMAAQANQAQASTIGNAKMEYGEPMRESLTGRLRSRLGQSMRESRKAEQLNELLYLLDKHPEIARILDLVEAVGSY